MCVLNFNIAYNSIIDLYANEFLCLSKLKISLNQHPGKSSYFKMLTGGKDGKYLFIRLFFGTQ